MGEREVGKSWGEVKDTLLRGGRKSIVYEKVPRLRPLVLLGTNTLSNNIQEFSSYLTGNASPLQSPTG
jgi:hypothetical protein